MLTSNRLCFFARFSFTILQLQLVKLVADSGSNMRASFNDADVIECEMDVFDDDDDDNDDEEANGDEDEVNTFTVRVPLLVRSFCC